MSVGAGVRGNINDHLSGYIEVDVPLIVLYSPQQSNGARFFFSLLVPF